MYFCDVLKHKWFVLLAGLYWRVPIWRLLVHDLSKFSSAEYIPYRNWFKRDPGLPEMERIRRKTAFLCAWELHVQRNDHHPGYWHGAEMPEVCIREMIADWFAASRSYGGAWPRVGKWDWLRDEWPAVRRNVHPATVDRVEQLLEKYIAAF